MFAHFIPQIYMQDNRLQHRPVIELRYQNNNNNKNKNKINHKKTSTKTRLSSIA